MAATVPSTAMTSMLTNHSFNITDPFFGKNLEYIPDINRTGRDFYTFYWRTELDIDAPLLAPADAGTRRGAGGEETVETAGVAGVSECPLLWLRLRGINYRAEVWMDGELVPEDGGSATVEGMFRRWNYLLPARNGGTNIIQSTATASADAVPAPAHAHAHAHAHAPQTARRKKRVLAVLVEPPPFPGKVGPGVGQGGSHELAKSTTMQFAGGWDWIQGIQ